MYAVLKSVGKQFKVSPGDVLKIDKIEGNVGDTISFKDIVAVGNGDKFELGSPAVKGAEVSAKLAKYFESFVLLISETCSQLSQIENAVAFDIWQLEF